MTFHFAHDTLILDASCIINLYASGQIEPILRSMSQSVTVAAYVYEEEALWIYSRPSQAEQPIREPIKLNPYVSTGLLQIVTIESEDEAETVATLSARIRDPGEVITGAIAINRNWGMVIDDRRARRVIQEVAGHVQLIYTLELVQHWAELNGVHADVITTTLQNIRHQATYKPHSGHPCHQWWQNHHGGE
jgi:predicted nucleic acid-binding protein